MKREISQFEFVMLGILLSIIADGVYELFKAWIAQWPLTNASEVWTTLNPMFAAILAVGAVFVFYQYMWKPLFSRTEKPRRRVQNE